MNCSISCSNQIGTSSFMGSKLCTGTYNITAKAPIRMAQDLVGYVTSTKMQKTIVVTITRLVPHPKYKRRVRKTKKIFAHDEDEKCKLGDYVKILPCRPLSKNKSFTLGEIVKEAR